jgi:predicted N-acetyltransferase YhbS
MTQAQPHENKLFKPEILKDPSSLIKEQLQTLISQLQTESDLLTERLSVEDLHKLIEQSLLTAILDIDQNIIATAMLWNVDIHTNWYEMGIVWVSPEYRGQNLGHAVFQDITAKVSKGSSAFLLTTS